MIEARPRATTIIDTTDELLDALGLALADAARKCRDDFPDIYVKVDELLAGERRTQAAALPIVMPAGVECAWCGDLFLPSKATRPQRTCSHECRGALAIWERKRRHE